MDIGLILGRNISKFAKDVNQLEMELMDEVSSSTFLVIGGAGTIGQAVVKEIFERNPKRLDVVDINENNLVELVRDLRSSIGYIEGDFETYTVPVESTEFDILVNDRGPYNYVLNLSALKHVRNEKDPYTLSRMIDVNVFNTVKSLRLAKYMSAKKYFCVSTDKAANPTNLMGATKRIMEDFLLLECEGISVSSARFANVAFSDGSLLHGFQERLKKKQPISAPKDVLRYFLSPKEAGQLCLLSCIFGQNKQIFFPKFQKSDLVSFSNLTLKFLDAHGLSPAILDSENKARSFSLNNRNPAEWPCYFFDSDTTGEKQIEEFHSENEIIHLDSFSEIGIVEMNKTISDKKLKLFESGVIKQRTEGTLSREKLKELIYEVVPSLSHNETGKFLHEKM